MVHYLLPSAWAPWLLHGPASPDGIARPCPWWWEREQRQKREREIRLQTPVFTRQAISHCHSEPRAKSSKLLVHNRQVTGNRDLTTAGGTKTISEGRWRQEDRETAKEKKRKEKRGRGKMLQGSNWWRYGHFSKQSLCALSRGKHLW